jgi:hypothetical protein
VACRKHAEARSMDLGATLNACGTRKVGGTSCREGGGATPLIASFMAALLFTSSVFSILYINATSCTIHFDLECSRSDHAKADLATSSHSINHSTPRQGGFRLVCTRMSIRMTSTTIHEALVYVTLCAHICRGHVLDCWRSHKF